MSNVIKLNVVNWKAAQEEAPESKNPLMIDWGDIERICEVDEKGEFIFAPDDTIEIGPKAEKQIRTIFAKFGLRQMPKTYVELHANWEYCSILYMAMVGVDVKEKKEVREGFLARREKDIPGISRILRKLMLVDYDPEMLDIVHKIHTEQNTFYLNTKNPRFLKSL